MKIPSKILLAIIVAIFGTASARATPILGGQIFVQHSGHVFATFAGSFAAFDNLLLLASPPNNSGTVFEGHVTANGTMVDLGVFSAGTELVFEINNQNGSIFSTGPANRNPDNLGHAMVDYHSAPGQTFVGFEDLFGGGDLDFNDMEFLLANVTGSVPDGSGSTAMLLGSAIVILISFRRFAHS